MEYITKHELRKELIKIRKNFVNRDNADSVIFDKLVDICSTLSNIFIYLSYGSEVDTFALIEYFLNVKKNVYVPICDTKNCTMRFSRITSIKNLHENSYGILEPNEIVDSNAIADIVIFPGIAFDICGNRIGYGKGYYDRFMAGIEYEPVKVGICYDFQLLDIIPSNMHDVKMDMIITENRMITV